jgi:hypothetical protein
MKRYTITLKNKSDKDDFCNEMISVGAVSSYIPSRPCELLSKSKNTSNVTFVLTDDEINKLKKDPRVLEINQPFADKGYLILTCEDVEEINKEIKPRGIIKSDKFFKYENPIAEHADTIKELKKRIYEPHVQKNVIKAQSISEDQQATIENLPSGADVDVIIFDEGHLDPDNPEYSININGIDKSRVLQVDWFSLLEDSEDFQYPYGPLYSSFPYMNHASHCAGIAAGKIFGWAKKANIYTISFLWSDSSGNWIGPDAILEFHNNKPINPRHGNKNPTIVNMSFGFATSKPIGLITKVVYRGVTHNAPNGGFTAQQLANYGIISFNSTVLHGVRGDAATNAQIQAMLDAGIILVGAAGNYFHKIDVEGGLDYDNHYYYLMSGQENIEYYHRGSSPTSNDGVICVGSLSDYFDEYGEYKSVFSETGPRVDVYAPGENIMSCVATRFSDGSDFTYEGAWSSFYVDYPGNPNYRIKRMSGTSMACPQVAGALACYAESNRELTPEQAMNFIKDNAVSAMTSVGSNYYDFRNLQGGTDKILHYPNIVSSINQPAPPEDYQLSLSAPQNLTSSFSGSSLVSLKWKNVTTRLNENKIIEEIPTPPTYIVERYSPSTGWEYHAETPYTKATVDLAGLDGGSWKFRIRATDANSVVGIPSEPTVEYSATTPTPTPTPTLTKTPTLTPTLTTSPTLTNTLTSSRTLTPTLTRTLTSTPTPTITKTPTLTRTSTPTLSSGLNLTPTITPTLTQSPTLTSTFTPTPTATDVSGVLLNNYITSQIRSLATGKDYKSRYFDGVQGDGLYGLDVFLDYYQNNLNSGLNDDSEATKNFVRNTNCWAYDIDLTCCSPWNMHPTLRLSGGYLPTSSNHTAGTLISPRHVIFCKHSSFYPPIGSELRFVTKDNVVVTRTLTDIVCVEGCGQAYPDIAVGVLDSDVPDTITFAKILPDNWQSKFSIQAGIFSPKVLAVSLNQDESVFIHKLTTFSSSPPYQSFYIDNDSEFADFNKGIRLYDSGNPVFIIINNQPVLLFVFFTGASGSSIFHFKNNINSIMSLLGGGYQLTPINLDSFPNSNTILTPTPTPTLTKTPTITSTFTLTTTPGLTSTPTKSPTLTPTPTPTQLFTEFPPNLYACNFLDSGLNLRNFEFSYIGNYMWADNANFSYIRYDSSLYDPPKWIITIESIDIYYAEDLYSVWKVISEALIPGYGPNDVLVGANVSVSSCIPTPTPTPTPTLTLTPTPLPSPLPSVLYGCEFLDGDANPINFTFDQYLSGYAWLDTNANAYINYDTNTYESPRWIINLNSVDIYYAYELFGTWRIIEGGLVPEHSMDEAIGYISLNSCDFIPPTPTLTSTPTPTQTITPSIQFLSNSFFSSERTDVEYYITIDSVAKNELSLLPGDRAGIVGGATDIYSGVDYWPTWPFDLPIIIDGQGYSWKQNYKPCSLSISYENNNFGPFNAECRGKGYSSYLPYGGKIALKVRHSDFNQTGNIKTFVLNNMISDHSKVKEYIFYKICRQIGTNFAQLFFNDLTKKITSVSNNLITTNNSHYLTENFIVRFDQENASRLGLSELTNYYVVSEGLTSTTFKVSSTKNGSVEGLVNITLGDDLVEYFTCFGLYITIEDSSSSNFLSRCYGDNNTNSLYEIDFIESGFDKAYSQRQYDNYGYQVDVGSSLRTDLQSLISDSESTNNWYVDMSDKIDMNEMTRFFALEAYLGHNDGYVNNAINTYMHCDSSGVFSFIPWGTDRSFNQDFWLGDDARQGMFFEKCIEDPNCCQLYVDSLVDISSEVSAIDYETMITDISGYLSTIIEDDTRDGTLESYRSEVFDSIITFMSGRQASLDSFLNLPKLPNNLSYSRTNDTVNISWDLVADKLNGAALGISPTYVVERYSDQTGWVTHQEVSNNSIAVDLSSLSNYSWKFRVKAKDSDGNLGLSSKKTISYQYLQPTATSTPTPTQTPTLSANILRITEAMSSSGSGGTADWFEITNFGASSVGIGSLKMDDNAPQLAAFSSSVSLTPYDGWTNIDAGESVVCIETSTPNTTVPNFKSFWNLGNSVKIATYIGNGLSSGGDGIAIFDSSGNQLTLVTFLSATTGVSFYWSYDSNGNLVSNGLSSNGVLGAYQSTGIGNIGSPGVYLASPTPTQTPTPTPTPLQ